MRCIEVGGTGYSRSVCRESMKRSMSMYLAARQWFMPVLS